MIYPGITILILAATTIVMVVCTYMASKHNTMSKVWGCMAKSLDQPVSFDVLEHHKLIMNLLEKI